MIENPDISFIVPCYNVGAFILDCIKAISNQTHKNFEAIFVNDGSTDNTRSIIEKVIIDDPRFMVINKNNEGVSSARNRGITQSRGDYIVFIDADDIISEKFVESIFKVVKSVNSDIHIFGYNKIDNEGNAIKTRKFRNNKIFRGEEGISKLYEFSLENELFNPPWNKAFSRKFLVENEVNFPLIPKGEDAIFNAECFMVANSVSVSKDVLYNYLIEREGSVEMKKGENDFLYFDILTHKLIELNANFKLSTTNFYNERLVESCYSDVIKYFTKKSGIKNNELLREILGPEFYSKVVKLRSKDLKKMKTKMKLFLVKNYGLMNFIVR